MSSLFAKTKPLTQQILTITFLGSLVFGPKFFTTPSIPPNPWPQIVSLNLDMNRYFKTLPGMTYFNAIDRSHQNNEIIYSLEDISARDLELL